MLKERIIQHLYFMEMNQLTREVQLDGYGVADEMDLVAKRSQFLAHLRCHHSTPAIGWITGDSDFHQINLTFSGQKGHRVINRYRFRAVKGFSVPRLNELAVIPVLGFQPRQKLRDTQVGFRLFGARIVQLRMKTTKSLHFLLEAPGDIHDKRRQDVGWQHEVK